MTDHYVFRGAPEARVLGPLPPGDYPFVVSEAGEPYFKNDHWILPLRLTIEGAGVTVFANPWSGTTQAGQERDGIGEFLIAVNRTPPVGEEPNWGSLTGAKGKCRLKTETAQVGSMAGKERNVVAFFHAPKQLERSGSETAAVPVAGARRRPTAQELDQSPDEIPF